MLGSVTPQQVGTIARVLRHRQRLRQVDVAHRAGVSRLPLPVVEIKTELGSVEGLLRPLDVKCRLARDIARDRFGWQPARVGRLVIMPEDSTVRRQVSRHARIVDVSLPHRSREVRQWLRSPHGQLAGLWFLSEVRSTNLTRSPSAVRRIRPATPRSPGPT